MKTAVLLFLTPFVFAANTKPYPRKVITCDHGEGGAVLTETVPGLFSFSSLVGFDGAGPRGGASLSVRIEKDMCILTVAIKDSKPRREYRWPLTGDLEAGFKTEHDNGGLCTINRRYRPSIGKCALPDAKEPGENCYGEVGRDIPVKTGVGLLYAYAGGFSLDTGGGSFGSSKPNAFSVYK